MVAWSEGDEEAHAELVRQVYAELSQLAASYLRRERSDHTLQTSALVHEAYLRLLGQRQLRWESRSHFFGIAAKMMRRILVDHARRYAYVKHGGGARKLSLDEAPSLAVVRDSRWVALDDALDRLAAIAPRQARIVELKFFAGLTREEVASMLEVSVPTVGRQWRVARAWLYREMSRTDGRGDET